MPASLSSLVWFACDDSSTSPRTPVYSSSTRISPAYSGKGPQDGVSSPLLYFDLAKAFWVQNMVSNFAYYRWQDVYPILRNKIDELQSDLLQKVAIADQRAIKAFGEESEEKAVAYVTLFSVNAGNTVHRTWMDFYGELFVQFRDFYTITAKADDPACGCEAKERGLSEAMKRRIVDETGDHYRVIEDENAIPVVSGESGAPPNRNSQLSETSVQRD
jgi:hypothetical protein